MKRAYVVVGEDPEAENEFPENYYTWHETVEEDDE